MADQALLAPSKPYKSLIVRNKTLPAIREKPLSASIPAGLSTRLSARSARKRQKERGNSATGDNSGDIIFEIALEEYVFIYFIYFVKVLFSLLPTAEQALTQETHSTKFQALLAIENKQMEVSNFTM